MLFNSLEFIFIFLPISFFVYFLLNKIHKPVVGKAWLVFASLFFYSWWNISYLPLIIISMVTNYIIGQELGKEKSNNLKLVRFFNKKTILVVGITFNLGLLGFFKYANFFLENINALGADFDLPNILLPLAISFFTFQQIAYLVDSYREEMREYDFLNYALFVTFFPQLIAGPIVHHKEVMPQFASSSNLIKSYHNIGLGLFIFSMGLFKKVAIADLFASWATLGFDASTELGFYDAWVTSLSYTFQLYFDFSGYTDMAIGAALLFNIRLPINFNSPYKATDIQDFWRRWHMTLSRFLRDYLYIPLGGNRLGSSRTYINLFLTFLLGGLWHGASWMFIIWGAMHGLALVIHRFWNRLGFVMPAVLGWFLTFNFVNITWVFFRAEDINSALRILRGMFAFRSIHEYGFDNISTAKMAWSGGVFDNYYGVIPSGVIANLIPIIFILIAFVIISKSNTLQIASKGLTNIKIVCSAFLFCIAVYITTLASSSVFLYFNF